MSRNPTWHRLLFYLAFLFFMDIHKIECLLQLFPPMVRSTSRVCSPLVFGRRSRASATSEQFDADARPEDCEESIAAIRLNKVLKATHSRREADRLIEEGRLAVNGAVSYGEMVVPYKDSVTLDGKVIRGWEKINGLESPVASTAATEIKGPSKNLEYIKYYKPTGIICTTDRRIKGNIIDELTTKSAYRPKHRVYPVGRLDKDSSGLILITSDGRLPNASLRRQRKQPKYYRVRVDRPLNEQDVQSLRSGIVITTVAQRDGSSKPLTAKTKPCVVTQLGKADVEIILEEGRNRQIRKMMAALGYKVVILHRVGFGNISLDDDMRAGHWKALTAQELDWIKSILQSPD